MRRFQDWPTRMDVWLQAHAKDSFAWGTWDCALMAASHLDNLTGSALYPAYAGNYADATAADAYLAALGVADLPALATMILGEPLKNVKTAQRGDIVTIDTDLGPALGFVDLSGLQIVALSPTQIGLVRLPLELAVSAWRV